MLLGPMVGDNVDVVGLEGVTNGGDTVKRTNGTGTEFVQSEWGLTNVTDCGITGTGDHKLQTESI